MAVLSELSAPSHGAEHRSRARGKGAHVRAQGCASSRRRAPGEKRRAVEPTGRWRDRHAGAMVLATFAETKVARSPWRRAEKDMDVEVSDSKARPPTTQSRDPACVGTTSKQNGRHWRPFDHIPNALARGHSSAITFTLTVACTSACRARCTSYSPRLRSGPSPRI